MSRVSGLVERVRLMVLRGEVHAGDRMVEVHLAETLRTSRGTVREVLRRLEGDGLLVANHSGGMRVVSLDAEDLAATQLGRAALEALSAGLAAERVRDGRLAPGALRDLDGLADAAEAATHAPAEPAAVLADRRFHRAVDALAANRPCHDALDRLWDRIVVAAWQSVARAERVAVADREHRDLLAAIAGGAPQDAADIARRHVLATIDRQGLANSGAGFRDAP
jgi:DNA-binding GntR family transcriptional regulator